MTTLHIPELPKSIQRTKLIASLSAQWSELDPADPYRDDIRQAADMLEADAASQARERHTRATLNKVLAGLNEAQQVAVPISESQIDALSDYYLLAGAHDCVLGVVEFVRAIEAHHKIGAKP